MGVVARSSRLGIVGFEPYTDDDDATTTCGMPARRAASSTCTVPVAFARWDATGSWIERGTDGRAARCTTASAPAIARSSTSASRIVPSTSSASTPSRLRASPVDRSSSATTLAAPASRRQRFAPMNPAPPLTSTLIRDGRLPAPGRVVAFAAVARLYLSPPDVGDVERELLLEAFDSNWIAPVGPLLDRFERDFASFVGVPAAAAVASGTAALHLALQMLGVGPGDVVVVPSLTFVAPAAAVTYVGATPVFLDSDEPTWNLDPQLLADELAGRARRGTLPAAVMVVDLYGQCADWDPIVEVCARYEVPVVEDAAEALGATYRGRAAGTFGTIGVF